MSEYTDRRVDQMLAILRPAPDGAKWPCGHPKTPLNTQHIGVAGDRCKVCRRRASRDSWRKHHGHDHD